MNPVFPRLDHLKTRTVRTINDFGRDIMDVKRKVVLGLPLYHPVASAELGLEITDVQSAAHLPPPP
jgi:hypothetical protein